MAFSGAVEQAFNQLTDDQKNTVFQLIRVLNDQNKEAESGKKPAKNNVRYGALAGGLKYIADDFDETPEGFVNHFAGHQRRFDHCDKRRKNSKIRC